MNPDDPADRAALANARAGATGGLWIVDRDPRGGHRILARVPVGEGHAQEPVAVLGADRQHERNALCACAAVNAVKPLLEALARAESERDDALHDRDAALDRASRAEGRVVVHLVERDVARRELSRARAELGAAIGDTPAADVPGGVRVLAGREQTLADALREYAGGYVGADLARRVLNVSGAKGAGT